MALRIKNVKVQPVEEFDLKRPSEDFTEGEDSNLHSIPEERLKVTPDSSKSSVKDDLTQNPVSIQQIHREVYFLRVLSAFLVAASIVSLALNIWVIHRDRGQYDRGTE